MPSDARRLAFVAKYAPILLKIGFWCHCRQIQNDADDFVFKGTRNLSAADQEIIFDVRFHASPKESIARALTVPRDVSPRWRPFRVPAPLARDITDVGSFDVMRNAVAIPVSLPCLGSRATCAHLSLPLLTIADCHSVP
jgi:hypothetical protein